MAENKVFMDTGIFTGIVEDMRGAAAELTIADSPLAGAEAFCGITGGCKMYNILEEMYRTDYFYNKVASVSLPNALFKVRDGMISVDHAASESLTVNIAHGNIGGTKK